MLNLVAVLSTEYPLSDITFLGYTQVAGIGAGTNGGQKMDYLNLAGRFGFAYQIHNGTVVRGAIGQVYDDVGFLPTTHQS
jgi:hypothetical protein